MDNGPIAHVLEEIADLLEIKGDNAFKIRAYRTAAETVRTWPDAVAALDERGLRALPGIGKDLATKIAELARTGVSGYHEELVREFPPTLLGILKLQGVGPKTVGVLYAQLGIRSVEELSAAAKTGRLRTLKGMGGRKEAAILKAIEQAQQHAGRHLLAHTDRVANELLAFLRSQSDIDATPVGSLRRGTDTCGDIDILVTGASSSPMDTVASAPGVERVLAHGDTKTSVQVAGGYQVDVRLVPQESRGAALQYFTGSKAHNIALRHRAIQRGLTLNEYGLYDVADNRRIAGETEEGLYAALGLAYIDPALREDHGEIDAAETGRLPRLVADSDIRGDLHSHTTETDGRDEVEAMARAAHAIGRDYLAITDHSQALAMANGMDERRALAHAAHIRAVSDRLEGMTLLAGVECDILPDGRLDLADDCLAALDLVIASVHSSFNQDAAAMTERLLRAIEHPWVDIIGHPTGRLLLRRAPYQFDVDRIVRAAAVHGVALEINAQVDRLDLNESLARAARERGVTLVISTDAHSTAALHNMRWGIAVARRAWASPEDVLNTRSVADLRRSLRRHRTRAGGVS